MKKGSFKLMKKMNQRNIMKIVQRNKAVSRAKIAEISGLSKATVSNNVKELIENKLIIETVTGESSGGRKPVMLQLNPQGAYFVGLEWGIEKINAVLVNLKGEIVLEEENSVEDFYLNYFIKNTVEIIDKFKKIDSEILNILGVGIGIHGMVNPERGISLFAPHFKWDNINIVKMLKREVNYPVYIDNDVRMMALAEKWKGKDNFIFINTGSGIGAGIIIKGELYLGSHFSAGELGHMKIVEDGPRCSCGNRGCLEALISTKKLIKEFNHDIPYGISHEELNRNWERLKLDVVKNKNGKGREILNKAAEYLGMAAANLVNILDIEEIIVGGKYLEVEEIMMPVIRKKTYKNTLSVIDNKLLISTASFADNAGAVGAAVKVITKTGLF